MTALTDMAAARPPGIADARVPCPLCGGLIHPVAGRCKHCKEDLSSYRAGRPQAAAALPALLHGKPQNGSNGHAAATANAFVPTFVPAQDSQPILPPRTTARSVQAQRPHSMWRSWPMLVICVAVIAIVAATVIMVMPPDSKKKDGKMSAPPAPERMETNPLPEKSGQIDPWGGQPGTVPQMPQPVQPVPAPPDPDDDDLWGGLGGGAGGAGGLGGGSLGGGGGGLGGGASFMITALDHACTKLKSCPDVDQSSLSSVCEAVSMMPKPPGPTSCVAARKCLDAIDRLDCSDAQSASPHSVFTMFNDCTLAATQC